MQQRYCILPRRLWVLSLIVVSHFVSHCSVAASINVAVAANFAKPMNALQTLFEQQSKHRLKISFASTGQLFAQIQHGAPFDVFLSADSKRVDQLINKNLAVKSSDFVYAVGQLVLWANDPTLDLTDGKLLKRQLDVRLVLPNPKLAPYGVAAVQTLQKLGVYKYWQPRFITSTSVTQAHQFISSGNVPLGFIALSQIKSAATEHQGVYWLVPTTLYTPIHQKAVLLSRAKSKTAADAFLSFLQSPMAIKTIEGLGYKRHTIAQALHEH